jgi:predicted neuraminidase
LVETTPNHLCVVWKGGPGQGECNIDLKENVGVWISHFDGDLWSEPQEVVSQEHSVCWNPVLCKLSETKLLLFYRVGPNPRQVVNFLKRSFDGGHTWLQEEMLPAGITGPTKNRPIVTAEGGLICPSSISVGEPSDLWKATACWIEMSADEGVHWKKIGPLELQDRKFGLIEPALFYDANRNLHMFCRDRAHKIGKTGYIWEAISSDGGYTWSAFQQTLFPNPDAAFDVIDRGEGNLVLIYNHSHTNRYPLNLSTSSDGGLHWSEPLVIDVVGEFPAAIETSDGLIHVTYAVPFSGKQRRIKHLVIEKNTKK